MAQLEQMPGGVGTGTTSSQLTSPRSNWSRCRGGEMVVVHRSTVRHVLRKVKKPEALTKRVEWSIEAAEKKRNWQDD